MRLPAAFTGFRRHGCFCEPVSLWRLLASHMAAQGSSWGAGVKLRTEAVATNSREEQIRIWNLCIARWREIKNGGTTSRGTSRRRSGGKRERQWWGARMNGGNCRTRYSRVRTVYRGRTDHGGAGWSRCLWSWRRFCRRARQPGHLNAKREGIYFGKQRTGWVSIVLL